MNRSSNRPTVMSLVLLLMVGWTTSTMTVVNAQNDNNGDVCRYDFTSKTFQRGESLADTFETRCGSWIDFPCYCNPDLDNQIECPYCGFATSTPELLRCIGDGQVASFVNQRGVGQSCECDASDPTNPIETCFEDPDATRCTVEMDDGSTESFEAGDEIVGLDNRCATPLPCWCNPNFPGGLECPYCSFATQQRSLLCLEEGESQTFVDVGGVGLECECQLGQTPNFPPNPVCIQVDVNDNVGEDDGDDCEYLVPQTGQSVTLQHLEIDVNVPQTDGSLRRCQCLDGLLDCEDDDEDTTGDGPPNPAPTPRPNPMPTPTTPVAEPTLAPIDTQSSPSGAVNGMYAVSFAVMIVATTLEVATTSITIM